MNRLFAVLFCGGMMACMATQGFAVESQDKRVAALADEYFDAVYFKYSPTNGTLSGFHRYDTALEDYSRQSVEKQIADLKLYESRAQTLDNEISRKHQKETAGKPPTVEVIGIVGQDGRMTATQVSKLDDRLTSADLAEARSIVESIDMSSHTKPGERVDLKLQYDPAHKKEIQSQDDLELVLSNIRGQLLALETIRQWEKNPDNYSGGVTNSIFSLMERKFAPPDERLKSVIAREKQIPAVFVAARQNLKNPPHIYTEIALQQMPDIISFFQNDVPEAFKDATDPAVKAQFAQSNNAVIAALQDYEKWMKSDLLPRSNGDFRIGADAFSKKLLYDEMVDTPLDRLLQIGQADLRKNQGDFNRIAKEVDPTKTPKEVLAELAAIHPPPDQLLASFHDQFAGLIKFIREKKIVTIPSEVQPTLEETPPFMRATTFASMDTPGPFEANSTTAYFNVTLPDKSATPTQVADYMAAFNIGTIVSTSVHEAYPGHYVQFLWVPSATSKVRKLLGSASNAEGWAHYCEQMMLDEGYGQPGAGAKDAREAKLIRLGQLQDALLRDARFIVGIQMHTGKMTYDQAIDFFVEEGYQSRSTGTVETKRGTADPTYLYYTLGKLQIMKLRSDMITKQGGAFSLEQFHDDFLKEGFPPIRIVRREMMADESPTL